MNMFSNFIPNKIKTFRDSDPPWMNDDIKNKIKLKHKLYHHYLRHKWINKDFAKLEDLCNEIDNLISKFKKQYYQNTNRKLNDPSTSSKIYWSIMKTFFNSEKVPAISPLSRLSMIFFEKTNIFNSFFGKHCNLVSNKQSLA